MDIKNLKAPKKSSFSKKEKEDFFIILKERIDRNIYRRPVIDWERLKVKLESNPNKLFSLFEMERTGGEPGLFNYNKSKDEYVFYDFSKESPVGRRSLCYDKKALNSRKENKPKDSAMNLCDEMGAEILTEEEYRELQTIGEFDTKTSSWVKTPESIRSLGGAIFCDRRYDTVFVYHNGAESYYAGRGFRASLRF